MSLGVSDRSCKDPVFYLPVGKGELGMCTEMLTKIVDHGYLLVLFCPHFPMLFDVLTNVCIFVLYPEEDLFS